MIDCHNFLSFLPIRFLFLFIKKKLGVAAVIPTLSMLWYSVDNAVVGKATARKVTALWQLPQGSDGAVTLGERTVSTKVEIPPLNKTLRVLSVVSKCALRDKRRNAPITRSVPLIVII